MAIGRLPPGEGARLLQLGWHSLTTNVAMALLADTPAGFQTPGTGHQSNSLWATDNSTPQADTTVPVSRRHHGRFPEDSRPTWRKPDVPTVCFVVNHSERQPSQEGQKSNLEDTPQPGQEPHGTSSCPLIPTPLAYNARNKDLKKRVEKAERVITNLADHMLLHDTPLQVDPGHCRELSRLLGVALHDTDDFNRKQLWDGLHYFLQNKQGTASGKHGAGMTMATSLAIAFVWPNDVQT